MRRMVVSVIVAFVFLIQGLLLGTAQVEANDSVQSDLTEQHLSTEITYDIPTGSDPAPLTPQEQYEVTLITGDVVKEDSLKNISMLSEEGSTDSQSTTGPQPPFDLTKRMLSVQLDYQVVIPNVPAYLWYRGCGPTAAGVDLSIQPPEKIATVGDTFSVTVRAEAGTQPVTGISAYLNFDPNYLEVQSITPGATLPTVMENNFDNTAGTINYSAGVELGEPFPSSTFDVATIQFKALAPTSPSTAITFSTTFPRETMVDFGGNDVTGTLSGGTVTIADALVDVSIVLQGGARPDPQGWRIPVTVKFFNPGADVMNDTPLAQFELLAVKSGRTAVCQCSVAPGVYDVTVVSEYILTSVRRNVTISLPSTSIIFKVRYTDLKPRRYLQLYP